MKTELMFFDTYENSLQGTLRGLIAFISLIVLDFIWFSFTKNIYHVTNNTINIYALLVVWLLICSAIAVQLPSSYSEALVYSLLVGFVIYGVFNLINFSILKEWKFEIVIMNTLFGAFNCAVAGSLIYLLYWKKSSKLK